MNDTQKQLDPVACDCGTKPVVFEVRQGDWVVHCPECCEGTMPFPTRANAVEDWNKVMGGM